MIIILETENFATPGLMTGMSCMIFSTAETATVGVGDGLTGHNIKLPNVRTERLMGRMVRLM